MPKTHLLVNTLTNDLTFVKAEHESIPNEDLLDRVCEGEVVVVRATKGGFEKYDAETAEWVEVEGDVG